MTLSSKLCKVIHQIDPTATRYSFPFKIFKKHEAAVWILGPDGRESARLRLDGDYLISGLESDSGGEIKLTESGLALAAAGQSLLIIRDMDFTQDIDYRPHDIFPAHSHEQALDLLTMQNQQLLEMIQRAPLAPVGAQAGDPWGELSTLAGQASEAAKMAESAARGAANAGYEAAAAAQVAAAAALKAESLSSLHDKDLEAHAVFTGDRLRYRLSRDTVFYVRPDGDDNNGGSADTPAAALKTLGGVLNLLGRTDQRGHLATVSLAPGNWPGVTIYGHQLSGLVRFTSSDPGNQAAMAGMRSLQFANIEVSALIFNGGLDALAAEELGSLKIAGSITFSNLTRRSALLANTGGRLFIPYGVPVVIHFDNVSCTQIAFASSRGEMELGNGICSGSASGKRYNVTHGAFLGVNYKGPDFIPGTIAGTVEYGGLYV